MTNLIGIRIRVHMTQYFLSLETCQCPDSATIFRLFILIPDKATQKLLPNLTLAALGPELLILFAIAALE